MKRGNSVLSETPSNPPTPGQPERSRKALFHLGFYTQGPQGRIHDKEEGDREFALETGGHDIPITEASFLDLAKQRWKLDASTARAAFHACDVDQSGKLNRYEYNLLRAALITYDHTRDGGSEVCLTKLVCIQRSDDVQPFLYTYIHQ